MKLAKLSRLAIPFSLGGTVVIAAGTGPAHFTVQVVAAAVAAFAHVTVEDA